MRSRMASWWLCSPSRLKVTARGRSSSAAWTSPTRGDVALGIDTYCVFADQGPVYGCVREAMLRDRLLRVVLAADAPAHLGVGDCEFEVVLDVEAALVARFRDMLTQILAYSRAEARPVVLDL